MKRWLFYAPLDIRLTEVALPPLGSDEVRVKIRASLTGGTDLKTWKRGHPKLIREIPSAFGYEFAGEVIESRNKRFQIGDRVVAGNTCPCFNCFFCRRTEYSQCINLEFLNGSFGEEIIIPANIANHNLYKIQSETEFELAAMTQTLAVVQHGYQKSQIQDSQVVLVYGLGPIGQSFIKLLRYRHSDLFIIAVGRKEFKLNLAKINGANLVINTATQNLRDEILSLTEGYGVDRIIEATGQINIWQNSLELIRAGGLINYFGGTPLDTKLELNPYQIHYQEVTITGSFHHRPQDILEALKLIESNHIDLRNLISATMPLTALPQALEAMDQGDVLKICIKTDL